MIIGLGTDIVEVKRFSFDAKQLARFSKKVFTEHEMAHAMRHRHRAERFAGAFAAKEATRKAFGHAIPWRLISVRHERSGRPYIELTGRAQALLAAHGVQRLHVSITHSRSSASATVILEAEGPARGMALDVEPPEQEAAR